MKRLKKYQEGGPTVEPTGSECPESTMNPQINATNENAAIQNGDVVYNPAGGEIGNPCAECSLFDISGRMQQCMQEAGETKGYCWANGFECESAGTCNKFETGGPLVDDEISYDMQGRYNNEPPPPEQQDQQMPPPGMPPPGIEAPQMGPQMGAPAYAFGGEVPQIRCGGPLHRYLPRAEYGRFTTPNVDYGRGNMAPDYSTAPWLNTNPYLAGFGKIIKSLYRGGKNLKNIWGKQKPITANYPMSQLTQEAKADYDGKLDVLNNYINSGTVASSGTCFASDGSPTICPPGVNAGTTLNNAGTATDMTPEIQANVEDMGNPSYRAYGGEYRYLPEAGFGDELPEIVSDPYTQIIVKNKPGSHADILSRYPGAIRNPGTNVQRNIWGNIKTNSRGSKTSSTYNIPNTITGGKPSFGTDDWTPTYYPADIGNYKTGKYGGSLPKAQYAPNLDGMATNRVEEAVKQEDKYESLIKDVLSGGVTGNMNTLSNFFGLGNTDMYTGYEEKLKNAKIDRYGRIQDAVDWYAKNNTDSTDIKNYIKHYGQAKYDQDVYGRRYGGSLPKAQDGFADWWRQRLNNLKDPNLNISGGVKTINREEDNSLQEGNIEPVIGSQEWLNTQRTGKAVMEGPNTANSIRTISPQTTQDPQIEDKRVFKTIFDVDVEPVEKSPAYPRGIEPLDSEAWKQDMEANEASQNREFKTVFDAYPKPEPSQNRELTPDDDEWPFNDEGNIKGQKKGRVGDTLGTFSETLHGMLEGANIIGDELEASRQRTHNLNQRMGDYAFEEMPGSQPYQPLGPDTNTGIYGPNRKVISHWGKYGTELPKAQTIGEFQNRIPLPSNNINQGSIKPTNSWVDKLGLTKPGFFGYGNPFWFGEHGMMGGKPLPSDWEGYNVPKLNIETQEWENQPYHTTFLKELQRTGVEPTGTLTSAGGPGVGFREYFPYSDPIGLGLETDVDPTGPGAGILLNNYRLRQFGNYLADRIGDNSVGNWFQDWNLPPGFTYAGVEMAGNLPMPFVGATVSTHDIPKLQKWAEHPDNQTILDIANYSKHGVGPGLYGWNKGSSIGGRFQLTNPLNPMAKPLWQSPDFFGGKRIHNPISGTGEGIGGRMGLRGGNIIPSVDLGPKSKYINPVNLFTKTKGPLELGFRGGFANIKEEVIAEAQELRKTGKLVDGGKDVIKYSKANKLLSQGDAMKKVYNVKTGAVPTGKLLTKTGVPSVLDDMGEALYGTKGPAAYQKSGNTLANMMRNSKIPYGKIINNPWLWKNLARGMMVPDALNLMSGLTHRPGQPVREFWSPGTNFGLDDPEMQKSSEYGMFPTIQNWWDHRNPVHPLVSTDQTEADRFKVQENKIYKEEFKKKHGSRPTPPTPVEDKPVFKAAGKQVWYDKDGKIHKVPEGAKIEYPSGLHDYQEPEMNWLQSMLPSHLQPQTIHERAPYAYDAAYKDSKTGKYVDLWSYDMPLRKSAEKKAPEAEQKRVEKEEKAWKDWYNSGEQRMKRAKHHSQNIWGYPKMKEGGVVNVDEDLLSELIAAGADIEIM